ncbi:MAG TPA: sigma-70 family RNA polymerase sigma factor [Thermomicrobiales bacterium]|nr:sigma-70 family RNA polymerase sigma factor [Thermomicrobiales bacterium]
MTEAAGPLERGPTDEALVARVARRDVSAFALLYDRYARPVYAMAAHLLGIAEADEVVQETFLRLWQRAGQYDPDRGPFTPWFMAIARHHVRGELRRRGREPVAAAAEVETVLARAVDPSPDPAQAVWEAVRGEAIRRALRALPEDQRRVLLLAYFGGLSQSAIARTLNWPLGTVKKRTRLAMQKLRVALQDETEPPVGSGEPRMNGQGGRDPRNERDGTGAAFATTGRER